MAGSIKLPHTCPKCNKTVATTTAELEKKFGLRQTNKTTVTNQSWCKICRSK